MLCHFQVHPGSTSPPRSHLTCIYRQPTARSIYGPGILGVAGEAVASSASEAAVIISSGIWLVRRAMCAFCRSMMVHKSSMCFLLFENRSSTSCKHTARAFVQLKSIKPVRHVRAVAAPAACNCFLGQTSHPQGQATTLHPTSTFYRKADNSCLLVLAP